MGKSSVTAHWARAKWTGWPPGRQGSTSRANDSRTIASDPGGDGTSRSSRAWPRHPGRGRLRRRCLDWLRSGSSLLLIRTSKPPRFIKLFIKPDHRRDGRNTLGRSRRASRPAARCQPVSHGICGRSRSRCAPRNQTSCSKWRPLSFPGACWARNPGRKPDRDIDS